MAQSGILFCDRISHFTWFVYLMIEWFKRNQTSSHQGETDPDLAISADKSIAQGILLRLRQGLTKTRVNFGARLTKIFSGKKSIDAVLFEELESVLIESDVGHIFTQQLLLELQNSLSKKELMDGPSVLEAIKQRLEACLVAKGAQNNTNTDMPTTRVILIVGVNGVGKTTSVGKLAKHFHDQGKKVMLAAGDTFRAAAVEQLQTWGLRNQVQVIAQKTGADSASVIFDAYQAAKARGIDILIADTAGRLHTQNHLMEELKKIKRVLQKIDPAAPHEVWLVLDAGTGQNARNQAREFHHALGVTGIIMTKLDGTAKGGILFAIAHELKIPFNYIGIGEGIEDLRVFDAAEFVHALFHEEY